MPLERKNTVWLTTCHSTNSYAIEWAKQHDILDGWVVYTFRQTNGRGQANNVWESEMDQNLTFSMVHTLPFLPPKDQFQLNMAVAIGVAAFLKGQGLDARIKWPNDLYVGNKKIGGILIENQLRGNRFRFSVIGVGLNINQTDFASPLACSLRQLTGVSHDLVACLEKVISCIEEQIAALERNGEEIREKYHGALYLLNSKALFRSVLEDKVWEGTIKGVDENGKLIIATEEGEKRFGLKEVIYVLEEPAKEETFRS